MSKNDGVDFRAGRGAPPASGEAGGVFYFDSGDGLWDFSHMEATLVKADDKGRVSLRGARKGAKYLVTPERNGWWIMPAPKITVPTKADSLAGTWELRAATLESFYDQSKAW